MENAYTAADSAKNNFLEDVYGVLFAPKEAYERLLQNLPILEALGIVVFVSLLKPLTNVSFVGQHITAGFIFSLFGAAISGIIKWVFFATFIEFVASVFRKGGRLKAFLTLTGFALLPWVFIGPVELLKSGGMLFSLIGVLFGIVIWAWTTVLTVFAAMKAYDITSGRILVLFSLPFLGGIIFINWIIGFFTTLAGILK